ncbi:DUF3047 domain-containing protein [Methylomonas rapida]|uniref:DUF3047 domain-containing protein n=1 Tax=Methylomonas rapida TaxID=2963939 RepID=A0ABY7GPX9_9GAMM|nr:DUF3047 domain-containing protein [Methylomonas rapida]WAR46504.1 DUF3047 domain-containing protein [Methylomonas rapida]
MKTLAILSLALLLTSAANAENRLPIGEFSRNSLAGWESKSFKHQTDYSLQDLDGTTVLRAVSDDAASGLYKEQRIDLEQTPYLNWSWRISKRLQGLNEQSKPGDDYAARVYVIVSGGLAFWRTRAVNYVWAGSTSKDTVWPNAFAGEHAMMLALRGPEAPLNAWLQEKRNVQADLKKLLGEDIRYIDAVALMSDTDNSGGQVLAYYGDIWFSKD